MGFDIDEEDYNWWVDISEYADLDPTQRFTKRVLALGNKEDYDEWVDLIWWSEFGD